MPRDSLGVHKGLMTNWPHRNGLDQPPKESIAQLLLVCMIEGFRQNIGVQGLGVSLGLRQLALKDVEL
jgi:hypothetical protein